MTMSIHDLLKKEISKMIVGIGRNGQGNIYPLLKNEFERSIIELVLQETDYNYFIASRMLGISRSTLYRKIEVLGIAAEKII